MRGPGTATLALAIFSVACQREAQPPQTKADPKPSVASKKKPDGTDERPVPNEAPSWVTLTPRKANIEGADQVMVNGSTTCALIAGRRSCSRDAELARWSESLGPKKGGAPGPGAVHASDGSTSFVSPGKGRRVDLSIGPRVKLPSGAEGVEQLCGDESLTCLLFDDGKIGCADSLRGNHKDEVPTPIGRFGKIVKLVGGSDGACVLQDDGAVVCFTLPGRFSSGIQLGGINPLPFFAGASEVVVLGLNVCVVIADVVRCKRVRPVEPAPEPMPEQGGRIVPKGAGPDQQPQPTQFDETTVAFLAGARQLMGHDPALCAVIGDSKVRCVVDLSPAFARAPLQELEVSFPGKVRSLAVSRGHACALLESGEIHCFGDPGHDRLGVGSVDR